ncbi:hypothetical protein IAR50_007563 [Cryptococcus sp. DSM 104548]
MSSMTVKSAASVVSFNPELKVENASNRGLKSGYVGRSRTIQPDLSKYYPYQGPIPQGYIFTCVRHGNWFHGTHFSDTKTYTYVCRNPASPAPASSATVRQLSSMLERGYGFVSCESPRRVHKQLVEDIATLRGDASQKFSGFVHVEFDNVWSFKLGKRTGERAGGVWMKDAQGAVRTSPGRKTYIDSFGKTRCAASADFTHM